jgi:hypothetical protein
LYLGPSFLSMGELIEYVSRAHLQLAKLS